MEIKWSLLLLAIFKIIFLKELILCFEDELSYEDLDNLNASCNRLDSCMYDRTDDDLEQYNCHCGPICQSFDSCCIDSKYRTGTNYVTDERISCSSINGHGFQVRHYYMIDDCPQNWRGDDAILDMCNSDGRDSNDPLLSVPVSNPITGITYKNYFCSVCNNDSSEGLILWNVALKSRSKEVLDCSVPELNYNSTIEEWTIKNGTQNIVVHFSVLVPDDIRDTVHSCVPDVISDCASDWTNSEIEIQCQSYMALARISNENGKVVYQNPHCAICNFENLEDMICVEAVFFLQRVPAISSDTFFVGLFSLHDKARKCDGNMVYDSLAKKCRTVFKG